MKKVFIALSANISDDNSCLHRAYIESVMRTGATPVIIPATDNEQVLFDALSRVDALVLTGGADVDAGYFGEENLAGLTDIIPERDKYDFALFRMAQRLQLPIFGICRGEQVIAIATGGSIWQDIPSQLGIAIEKHKILSHKEAGVHEVVLEKESQLARIMGVERLFVNSRHHQSVRNIGGGLRITGRCDDGVVEVIDGYPAYRILGVQWHPENMAEFAPFFEFIRDEALIYSRARELHSRIECIDSHCDTPMLFGKYDINFKEWSSVAQVDLCKMCVGGISKCFVVAYVPQGSVNPKQMAVDLLNKMKAQGAGYAIELGLENGAALEGDLKNIAMFRDMGVRYITLCHNGDNDICDSAKGANTHNGLSEFGCKVVGEMNRLGVVIDISHASEKSFRDALELSSRAVVASHSSVYSICKHPRNLTDDQIRALALRGGVIQICLYGGFLVESGVASVIDVVDHIDYVKNLVGVDYVGIGSDFDGGGGIEGCRGSQELINITIELLRRGYADYEIEKIWGLNFKRVVYGS